jgi:WD domain, G-beta repeat
MSDSEGTARFVPPAFGSSTSLPLYVLEKNTGRCAIVTLELARSQTAYKVSASPGCRVGGAIVVSDATVSHPPRRPKDVDWTPTLTVCVATTNEPLIEQEANHGRYEVALPAGHYRCIYTSVGFDTQVRSITITPMQAAMKLPIVYLRPASNALPRSLPKRDVLLLGATFGVRALDISTDGQWLLTGHCIDESNPETTLRGKPSRNVTPGGGVALWKLATGERVAKRMLPRAPVIGVAFSPGRRAVAAACQDGYVRLWKAGLAGKELLVGGHSGMCDAVVFSADGQRLCYSGLDGKVVIADAQTGHPVRVFSHRRRVPGLASLENGTLIASASWDGTVNVWDAKADRLVLHQVLDGTTLERVRFTHGGNEVIVAGQLANNGVGVVKVIDIASGRVTSEWVLRGRGPGGNGVQDIAPLPGGPAVVVNSQLGPAMIFDMRTRAPATYFVAPMLPGPACTSIASSDGRILVVSDGYENVDVWDIVSWKEKEVVGK